MSGTRTQTTEADETGSRSGTRLNLQAELRLFKSKIGHHVFVADGSRVYDLLPEEAVLLQSAIGSSKQLIPAKINALLERLGINTPANRRRITLDPIEPPQVTGISLIVAQACNMGCHYCYADEGRFGGRARLMPIDVARASVDRLFSEADSGSRLVLGFMGGEPLLARSVVHETARYAFATSRRLERDIGFSITTNATLLNEDDARLFRELPFTVTVSMDGTANVQREQRPMHNGGDSYQAILRALQIMERVGRPRQLAARATVTARSGRLLPLLDHMIDLGFDDVGFSTVLVSPNPSLSFAAADFDRHLVHMIECGEKAVTTLKAGRTYPFGNLLAALHEIHRGTHRPLPCGAGASYLSVNAEGRFYACHRLIDDPEFAMGDIGVGPDAQARGAHLNRSHVDLMDPCRECWARYLCGGGCHHEVKARGRIGCDFIRGWLRFCLKAYAELGADCVQPATQTSATAPSTANRDHIADAWYV
jgi:uncharacterized protein